MGTLRRRVRACGIRRCTESGAGPSCEHRASTYEGMSLRVLSASDSGPFVRQHLSNSFFAHVARWSRVVGISEESGRKNDRPSAGTMPRGRRDGMGRGDSCEEPFAAGAVKDQPCRSEVGCWIASRQVSEIENGAQFAVPHQEVRGVQISVEPDGRALPPWSSESISPNGSDGVRRWHVSRCDTTGYITVSLGERDAAKWVDGRVGWCGKVQLCEKRCQRFGQFGASVARNSRGGFAVEPG